MYISPWNHYIFTSPMGCRSSQLMAGFVWEHSGPIPLMWVCSATLHVPIPALLCTLLCSPCPWDVFCFSAVSPAALSSSSSLSHALKAHCNLSSWCKGVWGWKPSWHKCWKIIPLKKEPVWILCPESHWSMVSQEGASGKELQGSMCVRSGPGMNQSQLDSGVPQTDQSGLKYWPCNSFKSRVVLLAPGTVSFVLERLLQNASKLHNSHRLKPIAQNSYISNLYVPYYKSNCSPILYPLHPLFLTRRQGEHSMVLLCPRALLSHPGHALPP